MNCEIEYIKKELKNKPDVAGVYLFGSYARGDQKPISDIDICVINYDKQKSINYYGYSGKKLDVSSFNRLPLSAQFRVFKEGKPIFVKDARYIDQIKRSTVRDYLDNEKLFKNKWQYIVNK